MHCGGQSHAMEWNCEKPFSVSVVLFAVEKYRKVDYVCLSVCDIWKQLVNCDIEQNALTIAQNFPCMSLPVTTMNSTSKCRKHSFDRPQPSPSLSLRPFTPPTQFATLSIPSAFKLIKNWWLLFAAIEKTQKNANHTSNGCFKRFHFTLFSFLGCCCSNVANK